MNGSSSNNKAKNDAGLSVIEILIVMAMVLIVGGFIGLRLIRGNDGSFRQTTAVDFANHLQKARRDSMRREVKDVNQMAQVKVFNRKTYSMAIDGDEDGQLDIPLVINLPSEQGIEMNGPFPKTFIFDGAGKTVDLLNRSVLPEPVTISNSDGASAIKFSESGEVSVVPALKATVTK